MRRFGPVLVALALVAAACGDDAATTTTTTTPTTTAPPTTLGGPGSVPGDIAELIAETERIRGLEFVEAPIVTILSPDQLARRVHQALEDDLGEEDLAVWQATYRLLGLLEPEIDLGEAYRALYAEQVGGFYDSDTGELVVGGGVELSPLARSIVVHELVHALTDQHFGLAGVIDDLIADGRLDEALALRALAEGDATYFQLVYLQGLPLADQVAAVEESLAADSTIIDSLPSWFAEDLTFPYDAGFRFVTQLIERGGTEQVDQAYRLVPQTTEQILHPEKYFTMEPARPVELPAFEVPGFEVFEEGSFGEWNLQVFLLDGIRPGDKVVAASGWGGDTYRVYWDGSRVAFAYLYEGDSPDHAADLAGALVLAVGQRMAVGPPRPAGDGVTTFDGGPVFAQVRAGERRVLFVAADDPLVGSLLMNALVAAVDAP